MAEYDRRRQQEQDEWDRRNKINNEQSRENFDYTHPLQKYQRAWTKTFDDEMAIDNDPNLFDAPEMDNMGAGEWSDFSGVPTKQAAKAPVLAERARLEQAMRGLQDKMPPQEVYAPDGTFMGWSTNKGVVRFDPRMVSGNAQLAADTRTGIADADNKTKVQVNAATTQAAMDRTVLTTQAAGDRNDASIQAGQERQVKSLMRQYAQDAFKRAKYDVESGLVPVEMMDLRMRQYQYSMATGTPVRELPKPTVVDWGYDKPADWESWAASDTTPSTDLTYDDIVGQAGPSRAPVSQPSAPEQPQPTQPADIAQQLLSNPDQQAAAAALPLEGQAGPSTSAAQPGITAGNVLDASGGLVGQGLMGMFGSGEFQQDPQAVAAQLLQMSPDEQETAWAQLSPQQKAALAPYLKAMRGR